MRYQVDRFGQVASSLCAVHCALCGFVPIVFTALGLGFLISHEAEWFFTLVATALGAGAIIWGWRQHRSLRIMAILALGILGLLTSRGLEMASLDHDHHHGSHHAASKQAPTENEPNATVDHHIEAQAANATLHIPAPHWMGTGVGVAAGLLLLLGHSLNMRAQRSLRKTWSP